MKKKGNHSIFPKLLGSYFLFALIAVIIVMGGLFLCLIVLAEGDPYNLVPSEMVAEDGKIHNVDAVGQVGGWIEKLDIEYQVLEIYGNKRLGDVSYSAKELLSLTGFDDNGTGYHVFYEPVKDGGYLIYIPIDSLNVQYTYDLGGVSGNWRLIAIYITIIVLLVLEGILISRYIYRKIRRPLYQLTGALQKVEQGERGLKLDFRADGEFIVLRDAFNHMLCRLSAQEEENRNLHQAQQRFILELSHDIRTPIATLRACIAALEERVVAPEDIDRYYQTMEHKTERIGDMAEDMFTMLKMQSAEYQPSLRHMDLCEFMRRLSADYYEEVVQHDLEVEIDIPEKEILIDGDEKLLQRAVGNLITNAAKYNTTGSKIGITVKASADGRKAIIRIWDDGTAIDPDFVPRLFQPFSRADTARKADGGTGLGLTIAREIMEKHRGAIRYRYEDGCNVMEMELSLILI